MSVTVLGPIKEGGVKVPIYSAKIPAGFPSPADDHIERHLSIDEHLNVRAPHVYLCRVDGESMVGVGILDGQIIVVDRSIDPRHGHIVVVVVNGEHQCKRLSKVGSQIILLSENKNFPSRYILEGDEMHVWGVVIASVIKRWTWPKLMLGCYVKNSVW